jgi:hypothetical protein
MRIAGSLSVLFALVAMPTWACGDFDADEPPPSNEVDAGKKPKDSGASSSGVSPGADGGPRCNPTAEFGLPDSYDDIQLSKPLQGIRFSSDELTAYIWIDEAEDDSDLYEVKRPSVTDAWGAPRRLDTLNAAGTDDAYLTVTKNGLRAYFHRGALYERRLWTASRTDPNKDFENVELVPSLAADRDSDDSTPWISPDGMTLFFTSRGHPKEDDLRLFQLTSPDAANGALTELAPNSSGIDSFPVLSADAKLLFFKSGGDEAGGSENTDLYTATRTDPQLPFEDPAKSGLSQGGVQDFPLWMSDDRCLLFYRNGATIKLVKRGL